MRRLLTCDLFAVTNLLVVHAFISYLPLKPYLPLNIKTGNRPTMGDARTSVPRWSWLVAAR